MGAKLHTIPLGELSNLKSVSFDIFVAEVDSLGRHGDWRKVIIGLNHDLARNRRRTII